MTKKQAVAVVRRVKIIKKISVLTGVKTSALMRCIDAGVPAEMLGELVETANECGAKNVAHFASMMVANKFSIYEMGEIYQAKSLTNSSAVQLCKLLKRFPEIPIEVEEMVSVVNRIQEVVQEEHVSSSIANVLNLAEKGRFLSWEVALEYIEGAYWPNDDN